MFSLQRTNSQDINFRKLIFLLDKFLKDRDGEEHAFYHQFNKLDDIKNAVIYFDNNEAIGCGSFKKYDETTVEIKRMFVKPNHRGKGVATLVLKELEKWAKENNYFSAILETVKEQPETIAVYIKNGYTLIPNFGQYKNIEKSICMHKNL
jgi:putative acetyltransferase